MVYWLQKDTSLRTLNFRILDHSAICISPRFFQPQIALPSFRHLKTGENIQPVAGWPPALRGKKWFTFHERPLQPSTRAALETLQRNGSFSTLHAAVAYLQLEESRAHRLGVPIMAPLKIEELDTWKIYENMMCNVNPGLINPKRPFNWGVPFKYQIMTIGGVPPN